jgi:3-hydroxyisobutyrate dehydrogenase-like beta-hydroxyacid dehydrogenase
MPIAVPLTLHSSFYLEHSCQWVTANGLIEGMRPDTAFFDMSTNSVAMVRKINAAFAEKISACSICR